MPPAAGKAGIVITLTIFGPGGVVMPTPTVFDIPTGILAEGQNYLIGVRLNHTEVEGFTSTGAGIVALENRSTYYVEYSTAAPIPEPETYSMMLAGLALLGVASRRRARKATQVV